MPEGPEVETDKLQEDIHEETEREGGRLLRTIALTTALLAALAALASLRAGATVNDALLLKTEATRLQAEASDQWAYYQAKGVKASVQDAIGAAWAAAGKEPPPGTTEKTARYAEEQDAIADRAKEKERERVVHGGARAERRERGQGRRGRAPHAPAPPERRGGRLLPGLHRARRGRGAHAEPPRLARVAAPRRRRARVVGAGAARLTGVHTR